ncbi:MAG: MFS transporter [bacterium]
MYYFIFYMFPAVFTYFNIYLKSTGISATQIGLMNSVSRTLAILVLPLWGMMADYFGANKKVLLISLGGTLIFMLSFLLTTEYIFIFIIFIFYTLFRSPSASLSDSLLLNHLDKKSNEYGKFRVWGSLGYMITVTPFGYIIEQTQARILFFLGAIILLIILLNAFQLPKSNETFEVATISDFKYLFQNKKLFIFLILVFLLQSPLRANYTYFPIFFKDVGGGETLLGVAMVLSSGSELYFFQKSEKFLTRFSAKNIFTVIAVVFTLRWLLIALIPIPVILLLSQLLHGVTFGLLHVTTVYYITKIIGDSLKATGQNLYASTISISIVLSSLLGGIIYDQLGGANMYLVGSIISLLAGIGCYYNLFFLYDNHPEPE